MVIPGMLGPAAADDGDLFVGAGSRRMSLTALASGAGLIRAAECVSNAPVDGVGLAVDAVGVDLEQDGDAVSGAAGDLGGRHPGVEPQGDGGVAQVVGA